MSQFDDGDGSIDLNEFQSIIKKLQESREHKSSKLASIASRESGLGDLDHTQVRTVHRNTQTRIQNT
eukprot:COSAG06_NODE_6144_length_3087_cov_14.947122_4_plen_67_part_00